MSDNGRADLDALSAAAASKRTARAWLYREHLREILDRKQITVVSAMLKTWCTSVLRSKVLNQTISPIILLVEIESQLRVEGDRVLTPLAELPS